MYLDLNKVFSTVYTNVGIVAQHFKHRARLLNGKMGSGGNPLYNYFLSRLSIYVHIYLLNYERCSLSTVKK